MAGEARGQGRPWREHSRNLEQSRVGEAPGGAIERALTITATILALDVARGTVTLTGPQGRSQTFNVHRPADLEKLRVGDLVDITYSEALAVGVRPEVKK
jgi:hypothetical protein